MKILLLFGVLLISVLMCSALHIKTQHDDNGHHGSVGGEDVLHGESIKGAVGGDRLIEGGEDPKAEGSGRIFFRGTPGISRKSPRGKLLDLGPITHIV